MKRHFRIGEFAELTGVTVRTLHHYDRIGLLSSSSRRDNGYRLYQQEDLLRLQQILTLRHLGFKLTEIKELLERDDYGVVAAMRLQRFALKQQIQRLEAIGKAIDEVLEARSSQAKWQWELVLAASNAVQRDFESKENQMATHFTPEQMERAKKLRESLPDGYIDDVQNRWKALIEEVSANLEADPAGEVAQSLANRWDELLVETQNAWGPEPGLWEAIGDGYSSGAFAGNPHVPSPEVMKFIQRAQAAK